MTKYIDADRLRAEIERRLDELNPKTGMFGGKPLRAVNPKTFPRESELEKVLCLIDSLQQEQLPGIEEHGVPGKDFIPVEWVDACEKYGKWKIVQQEQPEVDLENEIQEYIQKLGFGYGGWVDGLSDEDLKNIARHFYELGLKARKV